MDLSKLHVIAAAVEGARERLRPDLASSFSSIRFTLAHLLGTSLAETEEGHELLENSERFLPDQRDEVEEALTVLAREVADSVNAFVQASQTEAEEKSEIYDPKVVFKSKAGVEAVEAEVMRLGRRLAQRDPTFFFHIKPSQ